MSDSSKTGNIGWQDLTVADAKSVRDFYAQVVGWKFTAQSMGDYEDFNMIAPSDGETVAGICHARGANADVPPAWLIYIIVDDVDASAAKCVELGGKIITGPRSTGGGRFAVIQDPAGAVCAIFKS